MPAKAGIQKCLKILDSRLRGNDANGRFQTFYEGINVGLIENRRVTSFFLKSDTVASNKIM